MSYDPELEAAVSKMQKGDQPMSKADKYQQLKKFALRQRTGTMSESQALVAFIERDPLGKQLYRDYATTKAVWAQPGAPGDAKRQTGMSGNQTTSDSDGDDDNPMATLRSIAATIASKHPGLSKEASMAKALLTPDGAKAFLADRRSRVGA
jgi:hypothetical protein